MRGKGRTQLQLHWGKAGYCNGFELPVRTVVGLKILAVCLTVFKSKMIRKGREDGKGNVILLPEFAGFLLLVSFMLYWLPHRVKGVEVLRKGSEDDQRHRWLEYLSEDS